MTRNYRLIVVPLLLVLLCTSFAVTQSPLPVWAATNTFTVTSAADPFPPDMSCAAVSADGCTLREAITLINSTPISDTNEIRFQIPKNTVGYTRYNAPVPRETWTITLTQTLPPLNRNGTLIDGTTQRSVPGTLNPLGAPIVFISGANLTSNVRGLILQSSDNTIRNLGLIDFRSGEPGVGIDITRQRNIVQGSYIGMNQIGMAPAPNRIGVRVFGDGARENQIGGSSENVAERNLISGNLQDGVRIEQTNSSSSGAAANKVQGNYIGVDLFGTAAASNGGNGVSIFESSANVIGIDPANINPVFGNIISGNGVHGVFIRDADGNLVHGNRIGVDFTASEVVGNSQDGVRVESTGGAAAGNAIGAASAGNVITGNGQAGVHVTGLNVSGTLVVNNYIGLAGDGSNVVGDNFQTGIIVEEGADGTRIGGDQAGERNVIGNNSAGIQVLGRVAGSTTIGSTGTVISGNNIGVAPDDRTARPNSGVGILLSTSVSQSRIGGTAASSGNRIVNNSGDGIRIVGTQMLSNTLLNNTIVNNGGNGLVLDGTRNTLISGSAETLSPISNNASNGVRTTAAVSTTLSYSLIGLNGANGVLVGTGSTTTTLRANLIGTTLITRTNTYSDTGNASNGVLIEGTASATSLRNNRLYFNDGDGVRVTGTAQRASILSNSISRNGGTGIELDPETSGLPGSASNPNRDINPPGNLQISESGRLTGRVQVGSAPGACITCTLQIFVNRPFDDGEGLTQLSVTPQIDRSGFFTATLGSVPTELTVTATDWYSNTSEFAVLTSSFGLDFSPPQSQHALPTQTIHYHHVLTNTGTVDLTNLQFSATSLRGWTGISVTPATLALPAGQSRPVTLTITLPPGTDPTAVAGTVEETGLRVVSATVPTATATVTDTTVVSPSFVLEVTPRGQSAEVMPGDSRVLAHTIRNNGNFTGTVEIDAVLDASGSQFPMTFEPTTTTLGPGQSAPLNITVSIPNNTQPSVPPVLVRVTVSPVGLPEQELIFTDTVTVGTIVAAQLTPGALEVSAQPGAIANFAHTVENLSTGRVTLRLAATSSQSSTIELVSSTNGVTIDSNGNFSLDPGTQPNGINILNFLVKVTVNPTLQDGDTDQITVYLYRNDTVQIGSAIDTVRVEQDVTPPPVGQLYLPIIVSEIPPPPQSLVRTRPGGRD